MTLGGRKGSKFGKPTRGKPQRFSSANDSNAYVLSENNPRYRKPKDVEEESEEEGSENSGTEKGTDNSEVSGSESEEEKSENSQVEDEDTKRAGKGISNLNFRDEKKTSKVSQPQNSELIEENPEEEKKAKPEAPRELTRKEREAIEAQKAREHYLKMKAKTDLARLEQVKKRREEEAAKQAALQREKESARMRR
jgi:hypothetical protein